MLVDVFICLTNLDRNLNQSIARSLRLRLKSGIVVIVSYWAQEEETQAEVLNMLAAVAVTGDERVIHAALTHLHVPNLRRLQIDQNTQTRNWNVSFYLLKVFPLAPHSPPHPMGLFAWDYMSLPTAMLMPKYRAPPGTVLSPARPMRIFTLVLDYHPCTHHARLRDVLDTALDDYHLEIMSLFSTPIKVRLAWTNIGAPLHVILRNLKGGR